MIRDRLSPKWRGFAVALWSSHALVASTCSFDSGKIDALACASSEDCSIDQDCSSGRCSRRPCVEPPDCGDDAEYRCSSGFCWAKWCDILHSCRSGFVCDEGFCRSDPGTAVDAGCEPGTGGSRCGDSCVDLGYDPANCGACGYECQPGMICVAGRCDCPPIAPQECPRDAGIVCVNPAVDPRNCGGCGRACLPGQVCRGGSCGRGGG